MAHCQLNDQIVKVITVCYMGSIEFSTTSFGSGPYHAEKNIESRRFDHNYMWFLQERLKKTDLIMETTV